MSDLTVPNQSTWTPEDTGGLLAEAPVDAVVDNILVYESVESPTGKVRRVIDGPYRASWAGIFANGSTQTSKIAAVLAKSEITEIIFDNPAGGDFTLTGSLDAQNKTISFSGNSKFTGVYSIQNAKINASPIQYIFGGTPTITTSKSATGSWPVAWFGAQGDGTTDDFVALDTAIDTANANTQKGVNLLPGTYLSNTNIIVPRGVILQFEVGAMISGSVTISGTGSFDCSNSQVFGSNTTILGLTYLRNEITPQIFGAIGDNSTNDSAAFQRMWDYVATLSNNVINIFIPPRSYYVPTTILLPKTSLAPGRFIYMHGYGATLRTDANANIFSRVPDSLSESTIALDAYKLSIVGLRFEGNSTAVADQTNQIGVNVGAAYTWEIINCHFYRLYIGINAQFWLNGKITNSQFTQSRYCDIIGRYGTWTGATLFNTAFNSNQICGCRFFSYRTAFTTVYLLAADQTIVKECISEGENPQYNFYMDYGGSTVVNVNKYDDIWIESVGGGVNDQNTIFYLRVGGEVHLKNIQRENPNRFYEIAGNSAASITVIVDGVPYFSNLPSTGLTAFSRNGAVTADWKLIFKNIYTGVVGGLLPPEIASNWDGGTLPVSLFIDTYTGVGSGATVGQRKSNLTEVISAQSVLIKNTLRAGVPFRGLGINVPQSTVSVPGTSSILFGITDLSPNVPATSLIGSQRHVFFWGSNTSANTGTQLGTGYVGNITDNGRTSIFSHQIARGTLTTPTAVVNTSVIGIYRAEAFDGTSVIIGGFIKWSVDGAVATGIIPTSWEVQVMSAAGALSTPLKVRSTGQIELAVSPTTGAISDSILVRTSGGALRQVASTDLIATGAQYQLAYYAAAGGKVSPVTLITSARALVSDANGLPIAATTTATEIGYVNGVTSSIQTQLNSKLAAAALASGSYSSNGDGVITTFTVTHSFGSTPSQVLVTPTGADSATPFYVNNKTSTTFDVVFITPPIIGTGNVKLDWLVK